MRMRNGWSCAVLLLVLLSGCSNEAREPGTDGWILTLDSLTEPGLRYLGPSAAMPPFHALLLADKDDADKHRHDQLIAKGFAPVAYSNPVIVARGTKVRVLETTATLTRVRVLEGENMRRAGWTAKEWVSRKPVAKLEGWK